jgi:hypothetical protein
MAVPSTLAFAGGSLSCLSHDINIRQNAPGNKYFEN